MYVPLKIKLDEKIRTYQILLVIAVLVIAALIVGLIVCRPQAKDVESSKTEKVPTAEGWRNISPQEIANNPVKLCDNLLTLALGKEGAMTIGWMTLGRIWPDLVAMVYVSLDRYTFEFLESNEYFTITAFPGKDRDKVMY